MLKPIASHTKNRMCVMVGSSAIRNKQKIMAKIGINGTNGVLNGRFKSGFSLRRIMIDADTIIKAARVPMFTNSANSVMGKKAAITDATIPTISIPLVGVLKSLWSLEKNSGSKPSLDIAKNTLLCPKKLTKSTDVIPHNAPMDIIISAQ